MIIKQSITQLNYMAATCKGNSDTIFVPEILTLIES